MFKPAVNLISRMVRPLATGAAWVLKPIAKPVDMLVSRYQKSPVFARHAAGITNFVEKNPNAVFWFCGLIPIVTGVLGTALMNRKYKSEGVPDNKRMGLIFQEGVSQALNIGFHLITYFGIATLLKRTFGGPWMDTKKHLEPFVALGANIGGFIGAAILRPQIGSMLVTRFINKESKGGNPTLSSEQFQHVLKIVKAPTSGAKLAAAAEAGLNPEQSRQLVGVLQTALTSAKLTAAPEQSPAKNLSVLSPAPAVSAPMPAQPPAPVSTAPQFRYASSPWQVGPGYGVPPYAPPPVYPNMNLWMN